jgi:hypothetical protein
MGEGGKLPCHAIFLEVFICLISWTNLRGGERWIFVVVVVAGEGNGTLLSSL